MIKPEESITVYRHGDKVALYSTNAPNIYLTQAQAQALASHLNLLVCDISARKFTASNIAPLTITDKAELAP